MLKYKVKVKVVSKTTSTFHWVKYGCFIMMRIQQLLSITTNPFKIVKWNIRWKRSVTIITLRGYIKSMFNSNEQREFLKMYMEREGLAYWEHSLLKKFFVAIVIASILTCHFSHTVLTKNIKLRSSKWLQRDSNPQPLNS